MITANVFLNLRRGGGVIYKLEVEVTPEVAARANASFERKFLADLMKPVRYFSTRSGAERARSTASSLGAKVQLTTIFAHEISLQDAMNS